MKKFMDEDFLLTNDIAKELYHECAEALPIIDYHCHVDPKDIAENRRFSNITELWLGGDHYKWRAVRSNGVCEKYVTGDASDYEKFKEFARVMPKLIGNPMYHWTHLELRRYFDCDLIINEQNCDKIWEFTNERLARDDMRVKNIIARSNVKLICTTDDPLDKLNYHEDIARDANFKTKVLPAFRPDKILAVNKPDFADYLKRLEDVSGVGISSFRELESALRTRLDYFEAHGCLTSDHSFDNEVDFEEAGSLYELDNILRKAANRESVTNEESVRFRSSLILFLASEYKKRGFVMQIHYGAMRNINSKFFSSIGADTGFDVINGRTGVEGLAKMLDRMMSSDSLPRTIIYSLNPCDNASIGALIGAFQCSGDGKPQIMQGSAWWFNDSIAGMREQMTSLASLSVFANFIGMLTDSRSFVSYPRHEYFRRILCEYIGGLVERGEYPYDSDMLKSIITDICFNNANDFFGFGV